jgi:hypothetical protein
VPRRLAGTAQRHDTADDGGHDGRRQQELRQGFAEQLTRSRQGSPNRPRNAAATVFSSRHIASCYHEISVCMKRLADVWFSWYGGHNATVTLGEQTVFLHSKDAF